MASSLPLKRLVSSSNLLSKSLRPACAASSRRLFNTNAVRQYDSDDRDADVDRRVFSPFAFAGSCFFSCVLFFLFQLMMILRVCRCVESVLIEEQPEPDSEHDGPAGGVSGEQRRAEHVHLRVDMPGLGKEDVKVSVEQNTLIIKGEGRKEFEEDEEGGRRYASRIDLPEKLYKTSEIKAEMNNGVLKVFVPNIKEEERNDVFHVNVN